jgi:hypothetical protein
MALRRATIKRRVGPALYQVMEPGDQIIAGTWASAGPGPASDLLAGVAGTVFFAFLSVDVFSHPYGSSSVTIVGPSLLPLLLQLLRRPVFIAVTQRQLICYRMSRMSNQPSRLLFSAPVAAVRMTRLPARAPYWKSARYLGPGTDGRGLRLNVNGRWRQDLNEVLWALQAGGAVVVSAPGRSPLPAMPQE